MGPAVSFPPCFESPKQYRLWRAEADVSARAMGERELLERCGHCLDCTPEYQHRMKAEARCLHPETRFVRGEDGLLRGERDGGHQEDGQLPRQE